MLYFRIVIFWDVLLVGRFQVFERANQRNSNAVETLKFHGFYLFNVTRLDDREESVFVFEQ
jgi:hypothetical protein